MKQLVAGGIALAALFAGSAAAADLPVKALYKAPAPAPVSAWTGFYGGINAGYGWGRTSSAIESADPASQIFVGLSQVPGFTAFTPDQFNSSIRQRGGLVGGQIGYNWQPSNVWVAGFEADIQYAHVTGSDSKTLFFNPAIFANIFPFVTDTQRELRWFGTVRGRLGFLVTPSLLIYGTGGLAYGETRSSGSIAVTKSASIAIGQLGFGFSCSSVNGVASTCYAGSSSRTSIGWAAGAGFEYSFDPNWSAKLEYLHVELASESLTLVSPPPSTPGVNIVYRFARESVDTVRVGLNYRFGYTPVVGKY
jgi:outer membrane immunogenic protein